MKYYYVRQDYESESLNIVKDELRDEDDMWNYVAGPFDTFKEAYEILLKRFYDNMYNELQRIKNYTENDVVEL